MKKLTILLLLLLPTIVIAQVYTHSGTVRLTNPAKSKEGYKLVTISPSGILSTTTSSIDDIGAGTSYTINVKDFGAIGDGIVDDTSAIETAIASATSDFITLFFPEGLYKITSQLEIWDTYLYISIKGDNAILQPTISDNLDVFKIGSNSSQANNIYPTLVDIQGLNFDFSNASPTVDSAGLYLDTVLGALNISNCSFYNYIDNNVQGIELYNIGNNPSLLLNNSNVGFTINSCDFYNPALVDAASYDYDSNNTYGTGVVVGGTNSNASEYWTISHSNFYNVWKAVKIKSGANGTFFNNNVQYCNPIESGGTIEAGIIEMDESTDNTGKLSIIGSKFNHNWGTSIFTSYSSADRPLLISENQFLANSYLPIKINGADRCKIEGNHFNRASSTVGLNKPTFTFTRYIISLNNDGLFITNNEFWGTADFAAAFTGGSSDNIIIDNKYGTDITSGITNLTDGVSGNVIVNNYQR